MKNISLIMLYLLLMAGAAREARKPRNIEPSQTQKPTRLQKAWQSRLYRLLAFLSAWAFGLMTAAQTVIAIWGPFWPTIPHIERDVDGGSPDELPFKITNASWLFAIKDANLSCVIDLAFLVDAKGKTILTRDMEFREGATPIGSAGVNYFCNAKFFQVSQDGSLEIGFPSGSRMRTPPNLFDGPLKVVKLCIMVRGSYSVLGMRMSFRSTMFQWPASPGDNRWISGPIAFETDESTWMPPGTTIAAAYGSRRVGDGNGHLLPGALTCDRIDAEPHGTRSVP